MFSVKSGYKLALMLKEQKEDEGQYNEATLGERKIWDIIWKANVPQKIRIFAWRAATNSLAVQVNRVAHHQATLSTCLICRVKDQNTFHALVTCPKAHALHMAMRDIWELPTEDAFRYTGSDWFFVVLSQVGQSMRDKIIFIFWRAWHLRNDLIFGKGTESVTNSTNFIDNYWSSFGASHSRPLEDSKNKGKIPMSGLQSAPNILEVRMGWKPPPSGYIKINVDTSFVESISAASVGVVARDFAGKVLISSWDYIGRCSSVEEAELRACIVGLYIGMTLYSPIILETDCAFVAAIFPNDLMIDQLYTI